MPHMQQLRQLSLWRPLLLPWLAWQAEDRQIPDRMWNWSGLHLLQEDLSESAWRREDYPRVWLHQGREEQDVLHHRSGGVQHRGLLLRFGWLQLCQHVSVVRRPRVSCLPRLPPPLGRPVGLTVLTRCRLPLFNINKSGNFWWPTKVIFRNFEETFKTYKSKATLGNCISPSQGFSSATFLVVISRTIFFTKT